MRLDQPLHRAKIKAFSGRKGKRLLLEKQRGDVWQWDRWQAGMAIVDFTNEKARDWYCSKLESLLDMGSTALRPISENGFRVTLFTLTDQIPKECTIIILIYTTRPYLTC